MVGDEVLKVFGLGRGTVLLNLYGSIPRSLLRGRLFSYLYNH